jgi:hypothetical protein
MVALLLGPQLVKVADGFNIHKALRSDPAVVEAFAHRA